MGPRANLTLTLLVGAATLVIAILIGNEMGNRVLGQVTERGPAIGATPVAPSLGNATNAPPENWRKTEVVSVATDPAFPDPRVPPPPPRTPRPYVAPPPTAEPPTPAPTPTKNTYTSPPLPIPIVTHNPDESPAPDSSGGADQTAAPSEDATP